MGENSRRMWGGWKPSRSSRSPSMVRSQLEPERWEPIMKKMAASGSNILSYCPAKLSGEGGGRLEGRRV